MMHNSLRHVTRVVSFMIFDVVNKHAMSQVAEDPQQVLLLDCAQEEGQHLFADTQKGSMSTEQLIAKFPLELIEAMAQWLQELWAQAHGPSCDDLDQMLDQLRLRTSSTKVDELNQTFLLPSRVYYD